MLGETIKQHREQLGLTLQGLAAVTRVSPSYLSEIERGLKKPSLKTINKIAEAIQVPLGRLLGESRPAQSPGYPQSIGPRISQLRLQQGLTQAALAERLAVSPGLIGQIENQVTLPSLQLMEEIALALGLPSVRFLVVDNEESQVFLSSLTPAIRRALDNPHVREILLAICTLPEKDIDFVLSLIRLYKQSFAPGSQTGNERD